MRGRRVDNPAGPRKLDSRALRGDHGRPMLARAASRRARLPAFAMLLLVLAGCGRGTGDRTAASGVPDFDPDSIPDAYRGSTAALMWPGATRAFQVRPDGALDNGDWIVRLDPSAEGVAAGPPRVVAYEERWRPVAHWRRWSGRTRWDFEALALPGPEGRDSGLVVSLSVRATNTGTTPVEARLAAGLVRPDSARAFVAADAPETAGGALRWAPASGDTVQAWTDADPSGATIWRLAPGASHATRLVLPAYPTPARALADWARTPHAQRAAEARRYWDDALARGTRFTLGDPEVERALAAARVVMLACRERRGPHWVPIGAPLHYRDVWLRDGARVVSALAVSGYTCEARELADGLVLLQWPTGAFVSQRGQLDGTGQGLWALEQAMLRPAPDDSVAHFAGAALGGVRWCEGQRAFGRQSGWPFGMMLPYGEPRDNELVRAQLVGNDAWAIAGYRATARLLRAAHREAEADTVEAARARYRADFVAALARSGAPDVPPSWQRVGRDWGNLTAAWPCGVLPASDPRCARLAARVWSTAGGAGLLTYGDRDSLHYYLGADLGTWALLAGRRAEADRVLDAMLQWRTASGGAGEIMGRDGGYGHNLPPHATSAAALTALVRNALVFDDADTLMLTLGARERWWRDGHVQGAPTRWGMLDLTFRRDGDAATWTWSPVPVWTTLTLPPGTRLAGGLPAPLRAAARADQVMAPPGTGVARVALRSAAEARP